MYTQEQRSGWRLRGKVRSLGYEDFTPSRQSTDVPDSKEPTSIPWEVGSMMDIETKDGRTSESCKLGDQEMT